MNVEGASNQYGDLPCTAVHGRPREDKWRLPFTVHIAQRLAKVKLAYTKITEKVSLDSSQHPKKMLGKNFLWQCTFLAVL